MSQGALAKPRRPTLCGNHVLGCFRSGLSGFQCCCQAGSKGQALVTGGSAGNGSGRPGIDHRLFADLCLASVLDSLGEGRDYVDHIIVVE